MLIKVVLVLAIVWAGVWGVRTFAGSRKITAERLAERMAQANFADWSDRETAQDAAEAKHREKELRDIASPVGMFVREVCAVGPEWSVDVADIYAAWCDWCRDHGSERMDTEQTFGRDLRAAIAGLSVARPRISGDRVRRYNGVGLVRDHSCITEDRWEPPRWSR